MCIRSMRQTLSQPTHLSRNYRHFKYGNMGLHESNSTLHLEDDPESIYPVSSLPQKPSTLHCHKVNFLTRLPGPPCVHVPPNCLTPSLLHAPPFSLYTVIVTLNTIAIDCSISQFSALSDSSADVRGNIFFVRFLQHHLGGRFADKRERPVSVK